MYLNYRLHKDKGVLKNRSIVSMILRMVCQRFFVYEIILTESKLNFGVNN